MLNGEYVYSSSILWEVEYLHWTWVVYYWRRINELWLLTCLRRGHCSDNSHVEGIQDFLLGYTKKTRRRGMTQCDILDDALFKLSFRGGNVPQKKVKVVHTLSIMIFYPATQDPNILSSFIRDLICVKAFFLIIFLQQLNFDIQCSSSRSLCTNGLEALSLFKFSDYATLWIH
jgi:hypothetical protein